MECYICYEKETEDNNFAHNDICKCKGTNRIHIKCFQKLINQNKCSICRTFFNISEELIEKENGLRVIREIDDLGFFHKYTINNLKQRHGNYNIYYLNGNIWEEQKYENGLKNGIQKLYSNKGDCFEKVYVNGIPL